MLIPKKSFPGLVGRLSTFTNKSTDPWCCYIWCAMNPINIPPLILAHIYQHHGSYGIGTSSMDPIEKINIIYGSWYTIYIHTSTMDPSWEHINPLCSSGDQRWPGSKGQSQLSCNVAAPDGRAAATQLQDGLTRKSCLPWFTLSCGGKSTWNWWYTYLPQKDGFASVINGL